MSAITAATRTARAICQMNLRDWLSLSCVLSTGGGLLRHRGFELWCDIDDGSDTNLGNAAVVL